MSRHCEFKMESRPYGSGHTTFAQIICGYCKKEDWRPASNGGWAMRSFRALGWKVGSKANQHRCPACFGKARLSTRIPDNPVLPKELGAMLKKQIVTAHVQEGLIPRVDLMPPAEPAEPVDTPPVPTPQPAPQPAQAPVPEPAVAWVLPIRGRISRPGITKFKERKHAQESARGVTGGKDGVEFYTLPLADGWTWKPARDMTLDEQEAWTTGHATRAPPRPKLAISGGLPFTRRYNAVRAGRHYTGGEEGATFTIHPLDNNWTWRPMPAAIAAAPPEEDTMTTNVTPIKDPMPTPVQPTTDARQPTRDERAAIHDELTKVYDTVDQRYAKTDSDKLVAERLNVPRVWVADLRAMFFGDFDRNQHTEVRKRDLDAAIEVAKAATVRLMEMAAEAESLERDLTAARKKLEG